ncbi:YdcF family protein [Candidatus Mycobacterium wuenschmannii]|uniref:YdcF family protein n=1 Tax=Candidatus Mycobacterium wuenschmannii TaxID=3027808 RepID=A0ABY8W2F1_9MYCO|nr:YdcF family protein [Candidatus Mycobacterium wuenschmannii]WIM88612.1 YdcF family protein [Candidatus Mycobacterium wuenschmannii]
MSGRNTWIAVASGVIAVTLGWSEWATWKASREFYPTRSGAAGDASATNVLVLGCPIPVLQRWRVRIAVRSGDPQRARFIFSGGAVRTPVAEATMMADYAVHSLGVPASHTVIEDASRTTIENIANSAPLLAEGGSITIASNTFHAHRARRILRDTAPTLADRLVPASDYRPFEWGPLHAALLAHEGYRRATRPRPAAESTRRPTHP